MAQYQLVVTSATTHVYIGVFRLMEGTQSIGRDNKCDIVLPSNAVSRLHGTITVKDNGAVIMTDLHSMNGTYVNGRKLNGWKPLKLDDTIRVGGFNLKLAIAHRLAVAA